VHHFHPNAAGELCAENVPLRAIAEAVGTPTYVYARATLERHYRVMDEALDGVPHLVCYAAKACSNLAVLQVLARLGSGFDIVSGGELLRVLRAGGDPATTVFSGVGKTDGEIALGLRHGLRCFNVESAGELRQIAAVARSLGVRAPISLRVNPEVDAQTHKYIATGLRTSKFGVAMTEARDLYREAAASPDLHVVGVDSHIGSQILALAPLVEALDRILELVAELRRQGIVLHHVDAGGGLGIVYRDEQTVTPAELGRALVERVAPTGLDLLVEPGRAIAGNAGLLITRVIGEKSNGDKRFVIVDGAMNDLLRPALYGAWHAIQPVVPDPARREIVVDVVGPVCESGDFLGENRKLQEVAAGELLAVMGAGAYGFAMASNYNSRPRAAEVLVDGDAWHLARARETVDDLWRGEALLGEVRSER
jgi:diaminopimelate decarboxylase